MSFRIVISASFTADPIAGALEFWGKELGVEFEVRFAPFQQIMQTLLDGAGEFAGNAHGVNVVMARAGDAGVESAGLARALRTAARRDRSPLVFVLCPDREQHAAQEGALRAACRGDYRTVDHREIARLYPVEKIFDETAEKLGAIPYTERYFAALGAMLARRIMNLSVLPYKAIAVDCDNTLWEGVCGEDGADGIRIDPARRALQGFLLRQRESGMLLCLASKNNAADVLETFARHPAMPLRAEHFTATRLDWAPKPDNLASLAAELNLGLDSFLFLDDNAKECAEMREARPEVLTLELPAEPEAIPHFLEHVWAFDHPVVTEEDRRRAANYAQAREFGSAFQGAHSVEEFMASLELKVEIAPVGEPDLARVAQLTQRTNQFNTTTIRRTEAEIRALQETHECLAIHVRDRFADYGLTGLLIFSRGREGVHVDTFLLSCRVLGRGVEHRVMAWLGGQTEGNVELEFRATAKNQPAPRFLHSLEFGREENGRFRFPAEALRKASWKPEAKSPAPPEPSGAGVPAAPPHRFLPFERIARDLSTVDEILAAQRRGSRRVETRLDDSLEGVERELAVVWADLLQPASLGPDDRFFECGGHSLLAVMLLARVKETFGVDLAIDDVYSGGMTLRSLAAKIGAMRDSGVEADEYEAMLAEIAALSDEEVKALLGGR